jgi:hypothetical protein
VEESSPEYEKLKNYIFELENHLAEAQKQAFRLVKRHRGMPVDSIGRSLILNQFCFIFKAHCSLQPLYTLFLQNTLKTQFRKCVLAQNTALQNNEIIDLACDIMSNAQGLSTMSQVCLPVVFIELNMINDTFLIFNLRTWAIFGGLWESDQAFGCL